MKKQRNCDNCANKRKCNTLDKSRGTPCKDYKEDNKRYLYLTILRGYQ